MKRNRDVYGAVYDVVYWDVDNVVERTVYEAVYLDVFDAMDGAMYRVVERVVYLDVKGAIKRAVEGPTPPHWDSWEGDE